MAKKAERPPPNETPMQRLERLTKKILQVPKEAIREPEKLGEQSQVPPKKAL